MVQEGSDRRTLKKVHWRKAPSARWARCLGVLLKNPSLRRLWVGVVPIDSGNHWFGTIIVFWMVENHRANLGPAILAETFLSLSFCHQRKGGKLKCCLQLLTIWIINHIYGQRGQVGRKQEILYHPLRDFNQREGFVYCPIESPERLTKMSLHEWVQLFATLEEDAI